MGDCSVVVKAFVFVTTAEMTCAPFGYSVELNGNTKPELDGAPGKATGMSGLLRPSVADPITLPSSKICIPLIPTLSKAQPDTHQFTPLRALLATGNSRLA